MPQVFLNEFSDKYRNVTRFLWLPLRLRGETRWLCFAVIIQQRFYFPGHGPAWKDLCFKTP